VKAVGEDGRRIGKPAAFTVDQAKAGEPAKAVLLAKQAREDGLDWRQEMNR
jgi:hypothetical protein